MSENSSPVLSDSDFSRLTMGERFSLALALSRGYGPALLKLLGVLGFIFLVYVSIAARLMDLNPQMLLEFSRAGSAQTVQDPSGLFWAGSLMLLALGFFLAPFAGVGLKNLVLLYLEGREVDSIWAAFLEPARRLSFFFFCFALWFAVDLGYQFLSQVLGAIPGLGTILLLMATLVYSMLKNCAMTYMADRGLRRGDLNEPAKAVSGPVRIIQDKFQDWVLAYLVMIGLFLIPVALTGLGLYNLSAGRLPAGALLLAGGLALTLAVTVFDLFFMAVTYKFASGGRAPEYRSGGTGEGPPF